jgi:hypothetical protein
MDSMNEFPSSTVRAKVTKVPTRVSGITPWNVAGLFAISVTTLNEVSRLIGAVESAGQQAYDAGVFTAFRIAFWNTDALKAAMALWRETQKSTPDLVENLLRWHLAIDAVIFVPIYSALLFLLLRRNGASRGVAMTSIAVVAVADWLETGATWYFLVRQHLAPSNAIWIIQVLSFLKWLAIAWTVATIAVLWYKNRRVHAGARGVPVRGALASVTIIVVFFTAAVALPAGGPLDQIPDVIRAQYSSGVSWGTRLLSTIALALLAASVATGAALAADPDASGTPRKPLTNRVVLAVSWAISLTLVVAGLGLEKSWRIAALAPGLVITAIWVLSELAKIVRRSQRAQESREEPRTSIDADATARYVGALAGVIVITGGIGLLRAAFPAWVLGLRSGVLPWWLTSIGAAAVVLTGGLVVQRIVLPILRPVDDCDTQSAARAKRRKRAFGITVSVITLAFAAWLTVFPDHAGRIGTNGVMAIGFGSFALVAGWFAYVARERIVWDATLIIGPRTPWLAIVVMVWLIASLLNSEGVYHDARVDSTSGSLTRRHASLDAAFATWLSIDSTAGCSAGQGDRPLVLIAAPGGGIRAAYWTASALDSLLGSRGSACATTPVFAMSGVSGGSLGLTTWIAAAAAKRDGRTAVAGMADDRALAAAAAGLFFRDALQPLVPLATTWRNRASLLEDGWERANGSPLANVKWHTLGEGLSWMPLLVLNGSSVTDGCRVLIANVVGLPAEMEHGCSEAPHIGGSAGPVSSALDGIAGLRSRTSTSCGNGQLRAATAALLSARFPVVSPSGALVRCPPNDSRVVASLTRLTYVVDGGYYENSGILSLLQMWRAIEPLVRRQNATGTRRIVPWLVVIDNHYRSKASALAPKRPLELIVPFKALSGHSVTSQAALEQMAWAEIAGDGALCGNVDSDPSQSNTTLPDTTAPRGNPKSAPTPAAEAPEAPRGCVVTIAPMVSPGVSAPLGWVLSETSRLNLDAEIQRRFTRTGPAVDTRLGTLLDLLRSPAVRLIGR